MRLLVDAHVFDGRFEGMRTYLEGLYTHMIQHKDIDFFFAASKEENLKAVFGEAPNIHYVHLYSEGRLKRLAIEFPKIIRKNRIDFAHFQYITPLVKTCREIVTIHDLLFMDYPQYFPTFYKLKNRFLFHRSAKRADLLLSVSEFSKGEIAKFFGIEKDRIFVTSNSILPVSEPVAEVDLNALYGLDMYILTVSRIEPRKNHLSLLKAFVELELAEQGYKLVMVGGKDLDYDDFFNYLEQLPKEIKENVLLLQVPFSHLVSLYRKAKLFVFPSFAEGFGIPPIEAIGYGCPLLCSNVTSMAEFGLPAEITFDPHDLGELKLKMLQQLKMPTNSSLYKESVLNKYNWSSIAGGYYHLLKSYMDEQC